MGKLTIYLTAHHERLSKAEFGEGQEKPDGL